MAILTTEEIQAALVDSYKAKQELNALDKQFNAQAEMIMNKARKDVEDIRASYAAQRAALVDAQDAATKKLEEGK